MPNFYLVKTTCTFTQIYYFEGIGMNRDFQYNHIDSQNML